MGVGCWLNVIPMFNTQLVITNTHHLSPNNNKKVYGIKKSSSNSNKMSLGTVSMWVRMVAPVVVKPDRASKKASVKLGTLLLSRKGSPPNNESTSQDRQMVITPSRWLSCVFLCRRVEKHRINPVSTVMRAANGMLKALMP